MCGIFAVIQKSTPICRERLTACVELLNHRGPDFQNISISEEEVATPAGPMKLHIGMAHTRLSIIDIDARSNQPYLGEDGSSLVYNGEIYNFREVKRRMRPHTDFSTQGDTELLFHSLRSTGGESLKELNGMWAFAFWNAKGKHLLAGRDRYGEKPIFYFVDDTVVCLSSEIKPILHYLSRPARFSRDAITSYLCHGIAFPPADGSTHVPGIRQVRPSHYLVFNPREWSINETSYFDAGSEIVDDADVTTDDLATALEEAVLSRLLSDRPVSLLLSGGIDSTLILSVLVSSGLQDRVQCFIGETGVSDDAIYARECVTLFGITARTIHLDYGQTSFSRFLDICSHQEKPFSLNGNAIAMPEMYEAISQNNVPVVLDGSGGDEVFGGYWDRYTNFLVRDAVRQNDLSTLSALYEANRDTPEVIKFLDRAFAKATAHGDPTPAPPPRLARDYLYPDSLVETSPDPLATHAGSFTEALTKDAFSGRLGEWLWQNDRNAMMNGVENRSPFLDHRLVRFLGTGSKRKFVAGWNKHELRLAYDKLTPMPTQWRRQKQGFRWQSSWFIRENKAKTMEIIANSQLLQAHVDVDAFLSNIKSGRLNIENQLTPRLLCVGALEHVMSVSAEH